MTNRIFFNDISPGTRVKVFSSTSTFENIVKSKLEGTKPFTATYIGHSNNKYGKEYPHLIGWKQEETKYYYAHRLEDYRKDEYVKIHIPEQFIFGIWLCPEVYCELDYFNETQKCKACLISAPHIDTKGKEYVCPICLVEQGI